MDVEEYEEPRGWRAVVAGGAGILLIAASVGTVGLGATYIVRGGLLGPNEAELNRPPKALAARSAASSAGAALPPAVAHFDALARSALPHERFEAYRLAQRCLIEAELEGMPGAHEDKTCQLPDSRWSDADLRRWLIRQAALDGVPGAWRALVEEGPDGRFRGIDAGVFREIEPRAYAAALARADRYALEHEAEVQVAKGNLAGALTMTVAAAAALAKQQQRGHYDPHADPHLDLAHYRTRLQPDEMAQSIIAGLAIVDNAP